MNLKAFHSKSLDQRKEIVSSRGVFLAHCYRLQYNTFLFYVNDFYAEVWYEPNTQEVLSVRGFTETAGLTPYLNLINLSCMKDFME